MKILVLIRHAKAVDPDSHTKDFDRNLSEKGKHDAKKMAEWLASKDIAADHIIASPAKRAKKTARIIAREDGNFAGKVEFTQELYEAGIAAYYELVKKLDDKDQTVFIIGHNPGISLFADSLTLSSITHLHTSGIAVIKIATEKWNDYQAAEKELLFFESPKEV